jgi:hypothetical protein
MDLIMSSALGWCIQNRPALEAWMTKDRFQLLMRSIAETTWGMNGGSDWSEQVRYLQSENGSDYINKLSACVKKHIESW